MSYHDEEYMHVRAEEQREAETKICPNCKQALPPDSEFCQCCGSKIETYSSGVPAGNDMGTKEMSRDGNVDIAHDENETVEKVFASGILQGQEAMEANKESQPHNELDADFGLVPQKPVYTVGIDEQEKYLKSLRTINGEPIKWCRRGSLSVDGVHGMVDVYDIYLMSGEEYKTIYVNMYGAYNSALVPKGFACENQSAEMSRVGKNSKSRKASRIKIALLITGIVVIIAILCSILAIREIKYQNAYKLLNEEKFDDAHLAFKDLGKYRDSEEMVNECLYQNACSLLDNGRYDFAIGLFEDLDGYNKSEDKIKEAKYRYVLEHANNNDLTTFSYLKELKTQDYKDSANIYESLYEWKIKIFAINSSPNDETTYKSSISKYDPVYFHFELSGGEPGEFVRIVVKDIFPDGGIGEYIFEDVWTDGDILWYGWGGSIYEYPEHGESGMLRCNFYDGEGNLIGSGSITITD